jgi:pyrimidine deaminase RibD-like protein
MQTDQGKHPQVGAVIGIGDKVIGRGRRGTGIEGDDNHAELNAIDHVFDKMKLPEATLYTTLEPCTRDVRTEGLKSCTELILQHNIRKVFVGVLDPNQGVTGKGLWRLQDKGVEVALFPHYLAEKIRVLNADFIRSQETLGATIISPQNGDTLKTYETEGKYTIRFKCHNPPGINNYLLIFHVGLCYPQPSLFRQVVDGAWETNAYFGASGEHMLYLVTANDLGRILVEHRFSQDLKRHN